MNSTNIEIVLDPGAFMPERAHEADAGLDLRTPESFEIGTCGSAVINTGVHIGIPKGYVGFLKSKSGLNINKGILSDGGVIDAEYTGAIAVKLYNHGPEKVRFERGDKITQLVILPIPEIKLVIANGLKNTERGGRGFGSSGK